MGTPTLDLIVRSFTQDLPVICRNSFNAGKQIMGRTIHYVGNLPELMQTNTNVALGTLFVTNLVFFSIVNRGANRLDEKIENPGHGRELTAGERRMKNFFLNGIVVGGAALTFNVILSTVTRIELNRSALAVLTIAHIALRLSIANDPKTLIKPPMPLGGPKETFTTTTASTTTTPTTSSSSSNVDATATAAAATTAPTGEIKKKRNSDDDDNDDEDANAGVPSGKSKAPAAATLQTDDAESTMSTEQKAKLHLALVQVSNKMKETELYADERESFNHFSEDVIPDLQSHAPNFRERHELNEKVKSAKMKVDSAYQNLCLAISSDKEDLKDLIGNLAEAQDEFVVIAKDMIKKETLLQNA